MIDALIITLIVIYMAIGYRSGFVRGAFEIGGVLTGAAIGLVGIRFIGEDVAVSSLAGGFILGLGLFMVTLIAFMGHMAGRLGVKMMAKPKENGLINRIDKAGGAALSAAFIMATGWVVVFAASVGVVPAANTIQSSAVLGQIDKAMPEAAEDRLMAMSSWLVENGLGKFLTPSIEVTVEPSIPTDEEAMSSLGVRQSKGSIVRIQGSPPCADGLTQTGTGFVYSPNMVMTNAHVVAGMTHPSVRVGDKSYVGKVVHLDRTLDLAVVYVKGLDAKPLTFDLTGRAGERAIVAGYPGGGRFDARGAQISRTVNMRGADIYGQGRYDREVFLVQANVRHGNSGGPLLSESGDVLGVVYAKNTLGGASGYVVTATQAQRVVEAAAGKTSAIETAPRCG